jgi:hypothetical protein
MLCKMPGSNDEQGKWKKKNDTDTNDTIQGVMNKEEPKQSSKSSKSSKAKVLIPSSE